MNPVRAKSKCKLRYSTNKLDSEESELLGIGYSRFRCFLTIAKGRACFLFDRVFGRAFLQRRPTAQVYFYNKYDVDTYVIDRLTISNERFDAHEETNLAIVPTNVCT